MPFRVYVIVNRSGNHELKFNWNRQQARGIPSEFSDGLSLADKDLLFDFQIGLTEFKKLSPSTLYITNCALQEKDAKKVFDRLVQIGVITDGGEGVNTKAIGRNFVNQLVMLPKCLQKRTVCLLFEWEEELVRSVFYFCHSRNIRPNLTSCSDGASWRTKRGKFASCSARNGQLEVVSVQLAIWR